MEWLPEVAAVPSAGQLLMLAMNQHSTFGSGLMMAVWELVKAVTRVPIREIKSQEAEAQNYGLKTQTSLTHPMSRLSLLLAVAVGVVDKFSALEPERVLIQAASVVRGVVVPGLGLVVMVKSVGVSPHRSEVTAEMLLMDHTIMEVTAKGPLIHLYPRLSMSGQPPQEADRGQRQTQKCG